MRRTLLTALSFTAVVAWAGCRGRHDLDLLRRGGPGAAALQGGRGGLGEEDRQRGQGRQHAELGDRAAGAVPADAGGGLGRHRRLPDRRHLAGHPRQPLHRPEALLGGAARAALQGHRRQQHGQRQAGGHAVVHGRGPALLPQGSAGEVRQEAAQTWQELHGRRQGDRGRERGRQRRSCGASSSRPRPTRA